MSTATDTCPAWPFKTSIDLARWIDNNAVTKITHHWRFIGEDTSENWIELHADSGQGRRAVIDGYELSFRPDHRTLIQIDRQLSDTIAAIGVWKRKHAQELSEFRRLQKKYGNTPE